MKNPERYISEPGGEERRERIAGFFDEVLSMLGYDQEQMRAFCEIRSREIAVANRAGEALRRPSDDRITELVVKGRTVATVVEIRDDFNYIQLFFANFMTPELLDELAFKMHSEQT